MGFYLFVAMTLKSFLCMLLWFATNILHAQPGRSEIGIEAGAGARHISSSAWKYNVAAGYSFGVSFQYKLNNSLSLRTNLHMERKGGVLPDVFITDEQGNPLGETNMSTNLDYLTLPILLRLSVGRSVKFFVNLGPYCGLLVRESYRTEGPNRAIGFNTSPYDNVDFGLILGMGAAIPLNEKWDLSVEARYNMGLLNISKGNFIKWSNQSAIALFGLSYKL